MTDVADPQLPLSLARPSAAVDPLLIQAQPTLLAAIKLCISMGGFEADKEVYKALDIDAGHWSRICRAEAHFPVDKLVALMDLCGNEAPLMWLLSARGYDLSALRKRESETEKALRLERERSAKLQERLNYAESLIQGRA